MAEQNPPCKYGDHGIKDGWYCPDNHRNHRHAKQAPVKHQHANWAAAAAGHIN